MKPAARADTVSSYTLKAAFFDEMWTACVRWDFAQDSTENCRRLRAENPFGKSASWALDITKIIRRRIDPVREAPLIRLAQAGVDRAVWNPLAMWHITRDEFLLRQFLTTWLWEQYDVGRPHVGTGEAEEWLAQIERARGLSWTARTRGMVVSGLFSVPSAVGLLEGARIRRFLPYHLPDESLLYLLHAISASQPNARRVLDDPDWRMFRLRPEDLERELLRLHQLHRLHYDVAGSFAQLRLPSPSLDACVAEMTA